MLGDQVTFEMKGLDQLQTKLERMSRDVSKKILRTALVRAGKIIMAAMVQLAPYDTGFLAKHFGMRTKVLQRDVAGMAYVGPEGRIVYPMRGVGAKQRTIRVETVARWFEFGSKNTGKDPFMTKAFEMEKENALNAIIDEVTKTVEEESR